MGNVINNLQKSIGMEHFDFLYLLYRLEGRTESYWTNVDYKMILFIETLEDIKGLSKNIIEAFDREHRSAILSKVQKKEELTKEEKVAVNCLYALIVNIGKLVYKERSLKDEERDFFLGFMGKYLEQLFPHIGSDIVAIRITEAILYTTCNILDVTHISKKTFWTETLLKYFQSKECSMEAKLASAIAITHIARWNMNIKQVKDIMAFLVNLPYHDDQMGSSRSTDITFMGFKGDEVKRAIEKIMFVNDQLPIHYACDQGNIDYVKLLIEKKSNIEARDWNYRLPIHHACDNGHVGIVKLLIEHKCDIEARDKNGQRPIHYACANGHLDIVKLLLENKCDIDASDWNNQRPIDVAGDKGHVDIVQLLNRDSSDIAERDKYGWRPIHNACDQGDIELVQILIRMKCDIEARDKIDRRPIHFACGNGHVDIVKLLIKSNCDIEARDENDWRPIHYACDNGHIDIVQLLIARKCDIEARDKTLSKGVEKHFTVDNEYVERINQMLCHIYQNESFQDIPYRTALTGLIMSIMKYFQLEFEPSIFGKIKERLSLTKSEKTYLNCFCNALHVLGQNIVEDIGYGPMLELYRMIFVHLGNLRDLFEDNIIGSRMAETLLYCLCNILHGIKNDTSLTEDWTDILWTYFESSRSSNEIKMASCVALAVTIRKGRQPNTNDFDVLHGFLQVVREGALKYPSKSYLGFEIEEIDNALGEVWIRLIDNDDLVKSSMDESYLSRIYELLSQINERGRNYISPQNISRLTNGIIRMFGVHFKSAIINQLENSSEISPRERLALNCVYASINILGNLHQTDPSLTFSEDKDLRDIFESFSKLIKVNAIANRMCESILYAMCNIYQPPAAIADKHWWGPKLKECYVEETCSGEMKLACSVLLGRMVTEDDAFDFDILLFLLRIATLFIDGRSQYLGFTASEIRNTATLMIQTLSEGVEKHFTVESECVEKINQMLCHIYQNDLFRDIPYQTALINIIMSIMKSFQFGFEPSIFGKIKERLSLTKSEKTYLNCFCNALHVLGQNIIEDIGYDPMLKLCQIIFVHLGNLRDLFEDNIIGSRMAETLLYCLCNLLQGIKKKKFSSTSSNDASLRHDWTNILWTYFESSLSSNEIKIASCVALAVTIRKDRQPNTNDFDVLLCFLRDVREGALKYPSKSYLGFEIEEIDYALGEIQWKRQEKDSSLRL